MRLRRRSVDAVCPGGRPGLLLGVYAVPLVAVVAVLFRRRRPFLGPAALGLAEGLHVGVEAVEEDGGALAAGCQVAAQRLAALREALVQVQVLHLLRQPPLHVLDGQPPRAGVPRHHRVEDVAVRPRLP